jgi:hypothetical protein
MIQEINNSWIEEIILNKPISIQGSYVIKFSLHKKPLYVQFPQCKIKNGIQKSGKKNYCDLVFSNEDDVFIDWVENLEKYCKKSIFKNKIWFDTDLDEDDIDNFFSDVLKYFKGKFHSMRVHIPSDLGIYDETGQNKILFENVEENTDALTIIEVVGIKCSEKNFQIEMEVKQMLLIKPLHLFEKCIIKPPPHTQDRGHILVKTEHVLGLQEPVIKEPEPVVKEPEPIIKEDQKTEINLEELIVDEEPIKLKKRNDIYQKMYKEAKDKAKMAKKLALMAYLEAKRIKNEYMIDDINDSENDEEDETV